MVGEKRIMEIVFKNKKRIEITEEEVQLIAKRIIDGCENFQVFSDKKVVE